MIEWLSFAGLTKEAIIPNNDHDLTGTKTCFQIVSEHTPLADRVNAQGWAQGEVFPRKVTCRICRDGLGMEIILRSEGEANYHMKGKYVPPDFLQAKETSNRILDI